MLYYSFSFSNNIYINLLKDDYEEETIESEDRKWKFLAGDVKRLDLGKS